MLISWLFKLLINNPKAFMFAVLFLILPLLFSIAIHEWAHGFVAYKFGDDTPKKMGRLSINPMVHLDLVGTLMLFIVGLGWAKPVMIDIRNIPSRTHQMFVALAGPASNFLIALLLTFLLFFIPTLDEGSNSIVPAFRELGYFLSIIIQINLILATFNMIPIPPLDGSKVLMWFLPPYIAEKYSKLEPYGMFIILLILFTVGFDFVFNTAKVIQGLLFVFVQNILG